MNQKTTFSPALQEATGEILYGLTNDYMFRILFQKNKLDIKMILNTHQQIDLEMQVNDYHDWPERSIGYLCHMYDSLEHGEEYIDTKPAIHIGILDYTPFPAQPLFYSKNQIMDVNTQRIYSDKFTIFVLDLSKADLATQDDCLWGINKWAKLFKATTWEELKMIADKNEYLTETSNTLCDLYADRNVKERCLDRIEYNLRMKRYEDKLKEQEKALKEKDAIIKRLMEENAKLKQ